MLVLAATLGLSGCGEPASRDLSQMHLALVCAELQKKEAPLRRAAILELEKRKDPDSVPALIQALPDKDFEVRSKTVALLGDLRAEDAASALAEIFRRQEDPLLSFDVGRALGKISGKEALLALVQVEQAHEGDLAARIRLEFLPEALRPEALPALKELALETEGELAARFQALAKKVEAKIEKDTEKRALEEATEEEGDPKESPPRGRPKLPPRRPLSQGAAPSADASIARAKARARAKAEEEERRQREAREKAQAKAREKARKLRQIEARKRREALERKREQERLRRIRERKAAEEARTQAPPEPSARPQETPSPSPSPSSPPVESATPPPTPPMAPPPSPTPLPDPGPEPVREPPPPVSEEAQRMAKIAFQDAWSSQQSGRTAEAIRSYTEALGLDPNLADAAYNLGLLYEAERDPISAITAFEKALRSRPTMEDARFSLGRVGVQARSYPEAIRALAPLVRGPSSHRREASLLLARAYRESGQVALAESVLKEASLRGNATAAFDLGSLFEGQGKWALAAASYRRASELGHPGPSADFNAGNAFSKAQDSREAEVSFLRALQRDPGHSQARYNLTALYYERRDLASARKHFLFLDPTKQDLTGLSQALDALEASLESR